VDNEELIAQEKLFQATGLKVGDFVIDRLTGHKSILYLSGIGYACVRTGEWRAEIWRAGFVKDELGMFATYAERNMALSKSW
jgi:hypothetical protein